MRVNYRSDTHSTGTIPEQPIREILRARSAKSHAHAANNALAAERPFLKHPQNQYPGAFADGHSRADTLKTSQHLLPLVST